MLWGTENAIMNQSEKRTGRVLYAKSNVRAAVSAAGASLAPTDEAFFYGVLIPVSEIRLCLRDWVRM